MDRTVVDEKLESLRRCLTRIDAKVPATPDALDWAITHRIATEHLDDFRAYARAIDAWFTAHP